MAATTSVAVTVPLTDAQVATLGSGLATTLYAALKSTASTVSAGAAASASTSTTTATAAVASSVTSATSLLAAAMQGAAAMTTLSGADKKRVVLAALKALAVMAVGDSTLPSNLTALCTAAESAIDVVAAVTQGPAVTAAQASVDLASAYASIKSLITQARAAAAGGQLNLAAITALLPQVLSAVEALPVMSFMATASAADQVSLTTQLLTMVAADAPAAEKPEWTIAMASVGPVLTAISMARSGTLTLSGVVAAAEANPAQVMTTCMTCFGAVAGVVQQQQAAAAAK